jgi:hypothetical protein
MACLNSRFRPALQRHSKREENCYPLSKRLLETLEKLGIRTACPEGENIEHREV